MSPTMILVLTAMVACGFGHPLQPMTPHKPIESSNYLNKSSWNVSSSSANYTNVLHMNMSQTIKNKMKWHSGGRRLPIIDNREQDRCCSLIYSPNLSTSAERLPPPHLSD